MNVSLPTPISAAQPTFAELFTPSTAANALRAAGFAEDTVHYADSAAEAMQQIKPTT